MTGLRTWRLRFEPIESRERPTASLYIRGNPYAVLIHVKRGAAPWAAPWIGLSREHARALVSRSCADAEPLRSSPLIEVNRACGAPANNVFSLSNDPTTMKLPLEISFEGLARSEAIEAAVTQHAAKLDQFCDSIMRCRVAIVCDEKHKHQGKRFGVRIDLTIPGHEIASNRQVDEDVYVAMRDAFKAASRQLESVER